MNCSASPRVLLCATSLLVPSLGCYDGRLDPGGGADGGLDGEDGGASDAERPEDQSDDDGPGPSSVPDDGSLLPISMSRLTASRYRNTVRDLFSRDIADALTLEEDPVSAGWASIGSRDVSVSIANVLAYEAQALQIAEAAVADPQWRERWAQCEPSRPVDDRCASTIIEDFGLHLFRRPLSDEEAERYTNVATAAAGDAGEFWDGLRYALAGMLLSPHFTHIVELGEPHGDHFVYSNYELASRLSYLLWDTTPDKALLDAAAAGDLSTDDGLADQVERMLADSDRVAEGIRAFSVDLLQLNQLDHSRVDPERFPGFTGDARRSMKEGTLRMMADMAMDEDREFLEVLEAGYTYADGNLAAYYEQVAPGDEMKRVEFGPDDLRVGLLTEPSLLAASSGPDVTSPTRRGRFVYVRMLCKEIGAPPPDVANDLPKPPEGTTRREQLSEHMDNPQCISCHSVMDPLGFGLENFDAAGLVQLEDNGQPVDTSGNLLGTPFVDAASLSEAVLEHEGVRSCFAEHLYRYATGTAPESSYQWAVDEIEQAYRSSEGNLIETWRVIAKSDAFRFALERRPEASPD